MQIIDLDGNHHSWALTGNVSHAKLLNKSSLHLRTRKIISNYFPTLQVLEEVPIQLRKKEILYLDFYLPLKKMCIEVHGEQHYKFVGFYHQNKLSFLKAQKRDKEKKEWCLINNISYIEFPYNENDNEWIERLNNA